MDLLILGAPGAGKGTQSKLISKQFGLKQLSTGDLLRSAVKSGSKLGLVAKGYMDRGELIPDEDIIGIISEALITDEFKNGVIFDGFPRTEKQADSLGVILNKLGRKIDLVLSVDVPFDVIIKRLSARRVCSTCGEEYNLVAKIPKKENICDLCNGKVIQRKDDNEETIKNRLEVYQNSSQKLIDYYSNKGNFYSIDGHKEFKLIFSEIEKIINIQL